MLLLDIEIFYKPPTFFRAFINSNGRLQFFKQEYQNKIFKKKKKKKNSLQRKFPHNLLGLAYPQDRGLSPALVALFTTYCIEYATSDITRKLNKQCHMENRLTLCFFSFKMSAIEYMKFTESVGLS